MGQQGSKSSMEARVLFQRLGSMDLNHRTTDTGAPVVHIQRKVPAHPACPHSATTRPLEKSTTPPWPPRSRCDGGGLVYVMDNPTGGVWVKPGEIRTRS